jgi:hypothetical protein
MRPVEKGSWLCAQSQVWHVLVVRKLLIFEMVVAFEDPFHDELGDCQVGILAAGEPLAFSTAWQGW